MMFSSEKRYTYADLLAWDDTIRVVDKRRSCPDGNASCHPSIRYHGLGPTVVQPSSRKAAHGALWYRGLPPRQYSRSP